MILISDSMRATGMPDGQYTLGGLDVKVVGRLATLVSDGAIAGSATNLMDWMRTVVKKMELPLETAVACATINPRWKLSSALKAGRARWATATRLKNWNTADNEYFKSCPRQEDKLIWL